MICQRKCPLLRKAWARIAELEQENIELKQKYFEAQQQLEAIAEIAGSEKK